MPFILWKCLCTYTRLVYSEPTCIHGLANGEPMHTSLCSSCEVWSALCAVNLLNCDLSSEWVSIKENTCVIMQTNPLRTIWNVRCLVLNLSLIRLLILEIAWPKWTNGILNLLVLDIAWSSRTSKVLNNARRSLVHTNHVSLLSTHIGGAWNHRNTQILPLYGNSPYIRETFKRKWMFFLLNSVWSRNFWLIWRGDWSITFGIHSWE